MSIHRDDPAPGTRFLVDRMLGTLCRYLRFMGYDTESASEYREGNAKEDTLLLMRAHAEERILLTMDHELARRGSEGAILVKELDVLDQVRSLARQGVIVPGIRLTRCSLCNSLLRPARPEEIRRSSYAPSETPGKTYSWCPKCRKLYWEGSHGKDLEKRIKELLLQD